MWAFMGLCLVVIFIVLWASAAFGFLGALAAIAVVLGLWSYFVMEP